jgi:hypothetical protein
MKQRPVIARAKVSTDTSQEESFQNTVLRPIIKMQHDLLIAYTKQYIASKKHDFILLNLEKKLQYISSCLEHDRSFRAELRGIVIGQFSVEEYGQYCLMSNAINKRMLSIIKERMIDHVVFLTH